MFGIVVSLGVGTVATVPVHAACQVNKNSSDVGKQIQGGAGICDPKDGGDNPVDLTVRVKTITNVLLTVAGAVAVIILIIGGITYITSTGDSTRIKQAKDTILYAIIGVIVTILAYAIVNYVASQLGG